MKNSYSFWTQWKNKADTSDTLPIDNGNNKVAQFDIDISQPLGALDFLFTGRLAVVGGGVDPASQTDRTLRMFTMQMTIERENGNLDIVPAGTPLNQVYRLLEKIQKAQYSACTPGGFAVASSPTTPFPYLAVSGLTGDPVQDYAFHFQFPFGFLSTLAEEYKAGILMPRSDFRSLKVTFTNIVNQGGAVSITRNYPFPESNNTFTFTGFGGSGQAQVQCFVIQADPGKLDSSSTGNAGKVVPIIRSKVLNNPTGIVGGSGIQNGLVLDKWDRGVLWQAHGLFEDAVTVASGATANRATVPPSVVGGTVCTVLRDVTLFANSQRLSEWNNLMEVLRQNTQSGLAGGFTKQDCSPSLLLITKNGQFSSLGDLRRFFEENDTVIMQYDNIQDPGVAGQSVFITDMAWGYQQVSEAK